jgi:MFS family permease
MALSTDSIGFGGLIYVIDCVTADTSTLKNRGLAYAFTASPWIITAFAGPPASESAYNHIYWRWGFGIFAAILPVVAAPFIYILKTTERKARVQLGDKVALPQATTDRTMLQSIWHYVIEFDGEWLQ